MTLQDVNNSNQDRTEAQELSRRREPADRLPSKSEEQARRLAAITELVQEARANGDSLTGPSGLLKDLTKMVLEVSLEEEMTEHLGHGKHELPAPAAGTDPSWTSLVCQRVEDRSRFVAELWCCGDGMAGEFDLNVLQRP